MTVAQETPTSSQIANGVTTVFPYSYTILKSSDIKVTGTLNGVVTPYIFGTHFTLSGVGTPAGSINFLVAPLINTVIDSYRDTPLTRDTDYQDGGDLLADTVDLDFDRLWFALQDIFNGGKSVPNALRVPSPETLPPLPPAALRDGYLLGFAAGSWVLVPGQSGSATSLALDLASTNAASKASGQLGFNPTLNYTAGTLGWSEASRREWNCADYPWLAKFDGTTNDTAAILACATAIYNAGGGTVVMPGGTAIITSIVFSYAAARTVNFRGAGELATVLQQSAAATGPALDLSTPGFLDCFSTLSDFSIQGNSKAQSGVRATKLASFTTRNLRITACDVAFDSVGCLVTTHENPCWLSNNIGYRSRKSGAVYCNLVIFRGGKIGENTTLGLDIGDASGVQLYGTDVEGNGTAANVATGGILLRSTCDDENGFANFSMFGGWLEGNKGHQLRSEACAGLSTSLVVANIASSEAGRAIDVSAGIKSLDLINVLAASPGDTAACGATPTNALGGTVNIFTGTAINHLNSSDSGGSRPAEFRMAKIGTGGLKVNPATAVSDTGGTFTQGNPIISFIDGASAGNSLSVYMTNGPTGNAAATQVRTGTNSSTGRSINAGGTVNVGGADYAEYETKRDDCGVIAPGDVVGFDAAGLITDKWTLAVSFGIKSTSPSIVGGDTWFSEEPIAPPEEGEDAEPYTSQQIRLEAARQKVDRIAYAGKVPINLLGATPGDWIAPVQSGTGIAAAVGTASNAVGRVRSILPDGRALVVVRSV